MSLQLYMYYMTAGIVLSMPFNEFYHFSILQLFTRSHQLFCTLEISNSNRSATQNKLFCQTTHVRFLTVVLPSINLVGLYSAAQKICKLLGISVAEFTKALLKPRIKTGRDFTVRSQNMEQVNNNKCVHWPGCYSLPAGGVLQPGIV